MTLSREMPTQIVCDDVNEPCATLEALCHGPIITSLVSSHKADYNTMTTTRCHPVVEHQEPLTVLSSLTAFALLGHPRERKRERKSNATIEPRPRSAARRLGECFGGPSSSTSNQSHRVAQKSKNK
jgi:hypothetical protein